MPTSDSPIAPPAGDPNRATLRAYQAHVADYIAGTTQTVSGPVHDWIDSALHGLSAQARILEIGSAFGRDAAYIAARGYRIDCTDAVAGFVAVLRERGLPARRLDLLADPLEDGHDLILANAVLLHLPRATMPVALAKLHGALAPGGRLAFSLKRGEGESWSDAKIGAPRFFCYWQPAAVAEALAGAGFASWNVTETQQARRAHPDWLYIIAARAGM